MPTFQTSHNSKQKSTIFKGETHFLMYKKSPKGALAGIFFLGGRVSEALSQDLS